MGTNGPFGGNEVLWRPGVASGKGSHGSPAATAQLLVRVHPLCLGFSTCEEGAQGSPGPLGLSEGAGAL